jgi:hypothetical protein
MILVLASAADSNAVAFAQELASTAVASILTCCNLAEGPAVLRYPSFCASSLTIEGRKVEIGEIDGVINLLPAVLPDEMFFYSKDEWEYQAAEFRAMLTFFLSELPCPVVNRATSQALNGPCASSIAWRFFAERSGFPVSPIELDTNDKDHFFGPRPRERTFEVACLAGRVIEPSETGAERMIVELSRAAKVEYLRATLEDCVAGPRLVTVSAAPDIRNRATRRALADYFDRRL